MSRVNVVWREDVPDSPWISAQNGVLIIPDNKPVTIGLVWHWRERSPRHAAGREAQYEVTWLHKAFEDTDWRLVNVDWDKNASIVAGPDRSLKARYTSEEFERIVRGRSKTEQGAYLVGDWLVQVKFGEVLIAEARFSVQPQ